ncbi:MAG: hydantoinase/oxoprolinase family protein [Armatimonadetes bacterium]|nr:hydantoinase/oxoprolinase family protein [Armatimonadota bacterium]
MVRAGIDIGGTFTDLVLVDDRSGGLLIEKVLSTPDDLANGVIVGLTRLVGRGGAAGKDLETCVHATTVMTNALIERKGARAGLLTSRGFRDILEFGTEQRYDIYDLSLRFPDPLVPRDLRREITERTLADGLVLGAPEREEIARVVADLATAGVESLAVSLLHAYRNPAHEQSVGAILKTIAPGVPYSLSSEVAPVVGEFERTSTTVANAYLQPLARSYLSKMATRITELGYPGDLLIMVSSGGLAAVDTAEKNPVRMLESGPAAGALAAAFHAARLKLDRVLGFDMGGTTAKLSVIEDGQPRLTAEIEVARVHRFKRGSGLPVRIPVLDLMEIGTGGGSLAAANDLGLLQVGPESAGAHPGPACYGRGGTRPTVTDADVVLGYIDPGHFLGGEMPLDLSAAETAIRTHAAAPLGLSVEAAALGIYELVCETMANATRVYLAETGGDPRRAPLLAFGGAGPVHARRVAEKLGIQEVIVPIAPGVTSAIGLLVAPLAFDMAHSHMGLLDELDWGTVNARLAEMEARGRDLLARAGVQGEHISVIRTADMRYAGQEFEITVEIPPGELSAARQTEVAARFEATYRAKYHWTNPHASIEALHWGVRVLAPAPAISLVPSLPAPSAPAPKGFRAVRFVGDELVPRCPVYARHTLSPDVELRGPAIVEERESTIVAGPRDRLTVDMLGNVHILVG